MAGIELVRSLLQQASAQGSRSTAINPITWAFATVLSAVLGSIAVHAPASITIALSVFAGVLLVTFIFAYVYLLINDRDALRSERFTLSKMAIERSLTGDSLKGFVKAEVQNDNALDAGAEPTAGQQSPQ
jgi:hypothetical protein